MGREEKEEIPLLLRRKIIISQKNSEGHMRPRQIFLEGIDFIRQIFINRRLIYDLTKRDFKTRYSENLFGLSWAVLEPLSVMLILWTVFSLLYSSETKSGYPYVTFLLCGIIPYDFFNKTINKGTRSIVAFSFLIKQVDFKIAILPLIYILTELVVLLLILLISFGIFMINHVGPSWYWFQLLYYIFCGQCPFIGGMLVYIVDFAIFQRHLYHHQYCHAHSFFHDTDFLGYRQGAQRVSSLFKIKPTVISCRGFQNVGTLP